MGNSYKLCNFCIPKRRIYQSIVEETHRQQQERKRNRDIYEWREHCNQIATQRAQEKAAFYRANPTAPLFERMIVNQERIIANQEKTMY